MDTVCRYVPENAASLLTSEKKKIKKTKKITKKKIPYNKIEFLIYLFANLEILKKKCYVSFKNFYLSSSFQIYQIRN